MTDEQARAQFQAYTKQRIDDLTALSLDAIRRQDVPAYYWLDRALQEAIAALKRQERENGNRE